MSCPFDDPPSERVFYEDDLVRCLWDAYPVSEGHALVITRRHVATWFDATGEEQAALVRGIEQARQEISERYKPHGFNIGINVHEAAGQTIFHVHVHVIPRYWGDVSDPRGGVRYVIPDLANYVVKDVVAPEYIARDALTSNLSTGPANPLLPRLIADLAHAGEVDIAVAFVMNSGASMIAPHVQDFLDRGGSARILTGDYLNVTDPLGLSRLLDLSGDTEVRVYQTRQKQSFHLKAYIFRFADGSGRAYIGSSNLSRSALQDGLEWNYRVVSSGAGADFADICRQFNDLFRHPHSAKVDGDWVNCYRDRRPKDSIKVPETVAPELPPEAVTPHGVQVEALQALEASRAAGNSAGLVVLATGLGKTWLSAFDSAGQGFQRVLFVAHREEILNQAVATFRQIRPNAKLGRFNGTEKAPNADVLFASIQTLGRIPHLRTFARDAFDYIIVDEFHHAAARTYRNLINHFEPKFLLGLTATPERTDGGDLLGLCQENVIYTCDLFEGIERGLLSPFRYFGVPDNVDYQNIPWRSSRFDPEMLDHAVATEARTQNALEQWEERGGERTLAFCCSMRHADYTAEYFRARGVNAVAVHSGSDSAPRAASLQQLEKGEIQVLCAVDMFNEGVDVPSIDTVLMLRPTESAILWTQQVGRGLRRAEGKDRLTVIDYIGNHRIFLTKVRTLLATGSSDNDIRLALSRLTDGSFQLPAGCEVTYDLAVLTTIESLLRPRPASTVEAYYRDYRERFGVRPSALEAFHEGYNPRQSGRDRWLELVRDMGDLSGEADATYNEHKSFLEALEITPMVKSFKMLVLLGALNEDAFPGEMGIERLAQSVRKIAARSTELRAEFGEAFDNDQALIRALERNPIAAWTGGQGTGGRRYFSYENGRFSTEFSVEPAHRSALQDFARELAEWRLADYQARLGLEVRDDQFACKVFHSSGTPILKLPDRDKHSNLPVGWVPITTGDGEYEANFVKIAVNVVREKDGTANVLAQILRKWFGPDAGLPGTNFRVVFAADGPGYRMTPQNQPTAAADGAQVGKAYSREQIPGLFGLSFSPMQWNQGFIPTPKHVFLLVTLDKSNMAEAHRYQDHFEAADRFAWQSQNRTTQASKHGQIIRHHAEQGIAVHLFVRKQSKVGQRAAPFAYCGEVEFVSWEGEKPISVQWRLPTPLSERLRGEFA